MHVRDKNCKSKKEIKLKLKKNNKSKNSNNKKANVNISKWCYKASKLVPQSDSAMSLF